MSQDIVLILPEDIRNSDIEEFLSKHWKVDKYFLRQGIAELQVHKIDEGRNLDCYVHLNEMSPASEVADDYKDHDMLTQELAAALGSSRYYHVVFNNREFYEVVMLALLNGVAGRIECCWIDDSYGSLIWGKEALKILQDGQ